MYTIQKSYQEREKQTIPVVIGRLLKINYEKLTRKIKITSSWEKQTILGVIKQITTLVILVRKRLL